MSVFHNNILGGAVGQGGAAEAYQIDRSLRFNSGDTSNLSKTFSSAGNRKTWTWSCWYKRSVLGTKNQKFFSCLTGSDDNTYLELRSFNDDTICLSGYATNFRITDAEIRDPSAWYHLVVACDTTQSSNSDRVKLYLNGVQQTFKTEATITQNADLGFNQAQAHKIGDAFDGYLAEIHFVDGTQLAATDFGAKDANNVWQPKEYSGSHGTNGFYLKFADNSNAAALGTDSSGNSNSWTVNNLDPVESSGLPNGYTADATTYSGTLSNIETDDANGITAASSHINFDLGAAYTVGTVTCKFVNNQGSSSANYRIELHGNSSYSNLLANSETLNSSPGSVQTITHDFGSTSARYLRFSYQGGGRIGTLRFLSTTGAISSNAGCDSLIDTPTNYTPDSGNPGGNYATFSPIDSHSSSTFANGNLETTNAGTAVFANLTMGFTSGKWYCEIEANGGGAGSCMVGVCDLNKPHANRKYGQTGGLYMYQSTGGLYSGGLGGSFSNGSYGSAHSDGDIIGIGLDMDNGNVRFYINGSDQGQANTSSLAGALVSPAVNNDTNTASFKLNTGARPFVYTPPTDHKAMCTTNFADPTIADGSTAFNAKTWSGNSSETAITGYNLSPDLVWIKTRSASDEHVLSDVVRGAGKVLSSSANNKESDFSDPGYWGSVKSFDSDGFTVQSGTGGYHRVNLTGRTYVGWAWDAGSSNTSIAAGDSNSSAYLLSQTWSNNITTTGNNNTWHSSFPATQAFNNNDSNYAHANGDGSAAAVVTLTLSPAISATGSVSFLGGVTNQGAGTISINGGTATNLTTCAAVDPAASDVTTVSFSGSISTITITKTSTGAQGLLVYGFEIDGKRLVDNGTTVPNVPSIASTVRANANAGFSIISYTGNSTAGTTLGHNLNAAPEFMLFKNREDTLNWYAWHKDIGNTKHLRLNTTLAATTRTEFLNNTSPTSSVITLGSDAEVNANNQDILCYAWTSVFGYSSFGSYYGNGNAIGPFVYTGFRPRFILVKSTANGENWGLFDTARDPNNNGNLEKLTADESNQEATDTGSYFDILSNGFKIKASGGLTNANNDLYIYAAFAENPLSLNGGLAR